VCGWGVYFYGWQDKYEEIKSVGKGSFGDVWLVRRKKDDRQFVLKKMHVGKTDKEVCAIV
jgi:hypothetical protein